jgi:hypothetical protein
MAKKNREIKAKLNQIKLYTIREMYGIFKLLNRIANRQKIPPEWKIKKDYEHILKRIENEDKSISYYNPENFNVKYVKKSDYIPRPKINRYDALNKTPEKEIAKVAASLDVNSESSKLITKLKLTRKLTKLRSTKKLPNKPRNCETIQYLNDTKNQNEFYLTSTAIQKTTQSVESTNKIPELILPDIYSNTRSSKKLSVIR